MVFDYVWDRLDIRLKKEKKVRNNCSYEKTVNCEIFTLQILANIE